MVASAAPAEAARAKEESRRIVQRLRWSVVLSELTQREIETRIGFSKGYLSSLLGGAVEIKLWQLLAILDAVGFEAGDFFAELYPRRSTRALRLLDDVERRAERPLSLELARLYSFGIESIGDFHQRLERCEAALEELDRVPGPPA